MFFSSNNDTFKLYSFEMDRNEELKHMRNVIDIIILTLLGDRNYFKNNAIRSLLREILLHQRKCGVLSRVEITTL